MGRSHEDLAGWPEPICCHCYRRDAPCYWWNAITVGNSQVKVVTQIESITEKLQLLTDNVGKLEERVRSLEIRR